VGRADHSRRVAPHRRCRRQVPGTDDQGHRRPAHRPARDQEGRPDRRLEGSRHALRARLRQVDPHRQDLRRLPSTAASARNWRWPWASSSRRCSSTCTRRTRSSSPFRVSAQLCRGRHQGRRRDRRRFGLRTVRRRQWRHQDRGRAVLRQGQERRRGDGVRRRLPAALPRRRASTSNAPAITSNASASTTPRAGSSRTRRTARRCTAACWPN
jgi:hypothetical protein